MNYKEVKDYYRNEHFAFFSRYKYPFYGITVHLDITALKQYVKDNSLSLNTNLCYLCTKAINQLADFRYRILDNKIVLYETIHIRTLVAHKEKSYNVARLLYDDDITMFNQKAIRQIKDAYENFTLDEELTHKNFIYFSSLPGIEFTALTHVPEDDARDTVPKITFGKYSKSNDKYSIPLGIQVNHLFIEGSHLSDLVSKIQFYFDNPLET